MSHKALAWVFELLWIVLAAVATVLVLLPLYGTINSDYLTINAVFVFLSVTFFRLIIFVKSVPYLSAIWMRVVLIGVLGILFFQFMLAIQQHFWDMDSATISRFLTLEKATETSDAIDKAYWYFRREFIFFAVTCQLMLVLLAARLVHSMWQFSPKGMNR